MKAAASRREKCSDSGYILKLKPEHRSVMNIYTHVYIHIPTYIYICLINCISVKDVYEEYKNSKFLISFHLTNTDVFTLIKIHSKR